MNELRDVLEQCATRLTRFRQQHQRIGEQNTKNALIEPVIAALGWDVYDLDEVHREYRRRGSDNPVDYALLLLRTPRLFIEAKGLGENLDDPRWANQTISYATSAGVEWVALTDGAEWRVYNAHAPVPIEQKLFRSVGLERSLTEAVELLSLLSKDNMRDNRIEELWKGFFVDRQVHAELVELFGGGEPAPELVALLDQRLSKLNRDDIRASLMRARATFDFPSATSPQPPPQPKSHLAPASPPPLPTTSSAVSDVPQPRSHAAGGATRQGPKRRVSDEERRLKLSDLIRVGRLRPGAKLYGRYLGQQHTAELLSDGRIRYGEDVYNFPSGAGEAVKIAIHGAEISDSRKATDGFEFWEAEDARAGDIVSLKEIRRRAATGAIE
ncbi:hypothetical protein AB0J86_32935 [Micromonospora sp. NPDC049559]|uniref:restriction system modified-DNA reader domain-containing protein n=1 Tax=Micromonospora sp. NPDC049559 TaxID=3155923 RepID=UPI003430B628